MNNVLIVEDDPALAGAIGRNLSARGYTCTITPTVAQACAALRLRRPDLVLLDIDLPDGSGWDVLRFLHAAYEQRDTAVIVLSALRPNARLVQEFGCEAVLEKPFPLEALLRQVVAQSAPRPSAEVLP